MIYVGYPCVGKSSISGKNKNIDLESSNFFYHNKELNSVVRDNHSWVEIYVNIAEDLNKQGFNVFCSSHLGVVTELKKRNIQFCGIFPSEHLKDFWIKRAENRYNSNSSDKNKKALDRIKEHYTEDVLALKEMCDGTYIQLETCNYDLNEVITTLNRSNEKYKFQHCACCNASVSGYCPISTKIGCVSQENKGVIDNIEEFLGI